METKRLLLLQPAASDAAAMVAMANDEEIARNLSRLPHPYKQADHRVFLDKVVAAEWVWLITSKADVLPMGIVGLTPDEAPGSAILGYWLGRAYWGHGYATEAAGAAMGFAAATLKLTRLRSGYFAHNPASGRVLEKLGFNVTGASRQYSLAADTLLDHVDMALALR